MMISSHDFGRNIFVSATLETAQSHLQTLQEPPLLQFLQYLQFVQARQIPTGLHVAFIASG